MTPTFRQGFLAASLLTTGVLGQGACEGSNSSLVKIAAAQYSECLGACPAVCQPAEEVFPAYLTAEQGKGLEAALPLLCRDFDAWSCILDGQKAACDSMITGSAAIGIIFPENQSALEAACAPVATTSTTTSTTNTTTPNSPAQGDTTAKACEGSNDALVTAAAAEYSECFKACPMVCQKAEEVFPTYFVAEEGKGREAAAPLICRDLATWMCVIETQKETCDSLIAGAARMGIALPQNKTAAEAECALIATTTTSTFSITGGWSSQPSHSVRNSDATLTRCLLAAVAALALVPTFDRCFVVGRSSSS
eukprot:TRINITY_DN10014_c0_g5_i3.p1 TRINITY_DN10014_c0_g5~~TRINITY_DN10014_c0_g5_i3.p1  ORF type:complete len:323 (+),score=46.45 TRINITY_DN10014_c0_g5_i3:46-969(+)